MKFIPRNLKRNRGVYLICAELGFVKLKDRQVPNIAIRLIVVNVFKTTVRINKIRKTNEPFAFIIITKGYLHRILKI